ncbi:hypothetical protein ACHAWC_010578 [Mediolabrus comicus]
MKPSKTLLPLALAAAAPSVLASSSSPRRLSGKSGKAASGRATAENYAWLVGNYTQCIRSGVHMFDGSNPVLIDDAPCEVLIEIVHLGGLSYKATASGGSVLRWEFYGTGSYNPVNTGKMKFVTDHLYQFNGTDYVLADDPDESDTEIMECSQLPGDEIGKSIVCDYTVDVEREISLDITATTFYTDPLKVELDEERV